MTTAVRSSAEPLPLEVRAAPDPETALYVALRTTLLNSSPLVAKLGGAFITQPRPEGDKPHFPSITFYGFGTTQYTCQAPVPVLWDGVWTFDCWATTPDEAKAIAYLVRRALQGPITVAGNMARVESLRWISDMTDATEEGDVARKTLTFRMLAYLRT